MSRTIRLLALALFFSVGLNFVAAGFFVGRAFDHPNRPPIERSLLGALGRDAPKPVRDRLRDSFAGARHDMRPAFDGIRDARRVVADALSTDPVVRGDLDAALARLRESTLDAQAAIHRAFADAVMEMDVADRRALVESWRRAPHRRNSDRPRP